MIRQYALEKQGEEEYQDLRNRHRDWILDLAERAAPELAGGDQLTWLNSLDEERDNIRSALNWCLESGDIDGGLRICNDIFFYWTTRGHYREGKELLELLLAHKEKAQEVIVARALFAAGGVNLMVDGKTAYEYAKSCYFFSRKLKSKKELAYAHLLLVTLTDRHLNKMKKALAHGKKAIKLMRNLGDSWGLAFALGWYGLRVHRSGGSEKKVKAAYEEGLAISRDNSEAVVHSSILFELALLDMDKGDYRSAKAKLMESLAVAEPMVYKQGTAQALIALCTVEIELESYGSAVETARKALLLGHGIGMKGYIIRSVAQYIRIARIESKWERAATLIGGLSLIIGESGPPRRSRFKEEYESCKAGMATEKFQAGWAAGRTMSQDQLIDYALEAE
jgi:non-specific serine/threonine protein kinase